MFIRLVPTSCSESELSEIEVDESMAQNTSTGTFCPSYESYV